MASIYIDTLMTWPHCSTLGSHWRFFKQSSSLIF